jgi:hypothetical protein
MDVCGQHNAPAALPTDKKSDINWTGGCVGPTAGQYGCGFEPRTVQPLPVAMPATLYRLAIISPIQHLDIGC